MIKTKCRIIKIKKETPEIIIIKMLPKKRFSYKPGQFLMVNINGIKRAYSIASSPRQRYIELCVKIIPNGKISRKLGVLKVGDEINIEAPYGKFIFSESKNPLFIAIGSGIAPIISMLRFMKSRGTLLYGFRHDEDFAYKKEILKLKEIGKIKLNICITKPVNPDYDYFLGRVTSKLKKMNSKKYSEVYLCGPPEACNDIQEILIKQGYPQDKIRKEIF